MGKAKLGDWVEVEKILLEPGKRSPKVPEDTQGLPFVIYTKGFLKTKEAELGEEVEIETLIGRSIVGRLCAVEPRHTHDFGDPVRELIEVGKEIREEIREL